MKPTFKSFNNNLVVKKWEGREINPSILGMEFQVSLEEEYFKGCLEFIEGWRQEIMNKKLEGAENSEYAKSYYEKLKKDLEDAKPKITIKIELEKYEN